MILEAIISSLLGIAAEGVISKANDSIKISLKRIGIDIPPPNDFEGVYIHALIEFSEGKPPAAIELFKHEFIQDAFRQAYEQNNTNKLIAEIENFIDWHDVGESFQEIDVDPKIFVEEFAKIFHFVVDRTRTPYQIREENALGTILNNQQYSTKLLEEIRASISGNVDEVNIPEQIYKDRIEQARKFVKQGKSMAGKEILKGLEKELEGKDVSRKLQYELCVNIASAHLHLEENDEACSYLDAAFFYNKNEPKAIANAALSAMLQEKNIQAVDLAKESLRLDENQATAISVLLQVSKKENVEISAEVNQMAMKHTESRRVLAIFSFEEKKFEIAEKLYRENLSASDSEVQDSVLLAQAIITSEEAKIPEGTHFFALPEEIKERLDEAEKLLISRKNEWEKDDNRKRFVNTLSLLIQVQSLQRKNDLVWSNCQQILVEFPNYYSALFQCGLIEFYRNNYKGAIGYFEKALAVQDVLDTRDRRIPLATAYLQDKKYNKVITLLQDEYSSDLDRAKAERFVLLTKAYLALNDKENARNSVALLDLLKKEDPYVLEGLAQAQGDLGEHKQALENLKLAYMLASEAEKSYFSIILAEYYYQRGEFEKAIPFYEESFTPNKDVPVINHYLISLLNSGNYEKADTLAKLFRKDDATNPVFTVIEARVAEYIGELGYAKTLYLQLKDSEPQNPDYLVRAALIDYRNGKNEEAFNLLQVNIDRIWNDPLALMTVAQIGASAKKDTTEILEYAYRARRLGINDAKIHVAYVGLLFGLDDSFDKILELDKVAVDTSVCVRVDGKAHKWYTILKNEPVDKGAGEILVTDSLAQKMIGLQKGGVIQIKDDYYDRLELFVVDIKSKYLSALHATLEEFRVMFPENLSIQMMKTEGGDPTKAIAFSAHQNQIVRQISEFYARENITVGQFSKLIGRNQIEAWAGLGFNSGIVKASIGSFDEQAKHGINIRNAKDITLELTGLLTFANIEKLDILLGRFENIYVSQSVLDVIIEEINAKQSFVKDHLSIEHTQEQIAVYETKKEQIQHNVDFLIGIKIFVQEKCKIVPVKLALKLGREKYENLVGKLSAPSIDSALVAKETNTLLCSDDVVLRGIVEAEVAVDGVWTQSILLDCLEKGLLSNKAYHESISVLIFLNYSYVSLKAETLIFFLEKSNWSIASETVRLFQIIAGPSTTLESAMQIATVCVQEVWSKSILLHQKNDILNLILSSLVKNRLSIPTIRLFTNSIRKFYINSFTPWYADEIIAYTNSWLHMHLSINQKGLLF